MKRKRRFNCWDSLQRYQPCRVLLVFLAVLCFAMLLLGGGWASVVRLGVRRSPRGRQFSAAGNFWWAARRGSGGTGQVFSVREQVSNGLTLSRSPRCYDASSSRTI